MLQNIIFIIETINFKTKEIQYQKQNKKEKLHNQSKTLSNLLNAINFLVLCLINLFLNFKKKTEYEISRAFEYRT